MSQGMLKQQLKCVGAGEDSQLLVLSLPGELIGDDVPSSCMAIPILNRDGGVLLGIPSAYILPHALLEAAGTDDSSLLGPSKEVEAFLLEEDEDGNERQLEFAKRFLVVDFSNQVLDFLRPYDPVTDPSVVLQPFDEEHLEAIVDVRAAYPDIAAWLENLAPGQRENFLSAREEQASPKVGPKRATKRVTAAALAVQVESLSAQVAVMAQQQKEFMDAQQKAARSAIPAAAPLPGRTPAPRLPDVSAGLQLGNVLSTAKAAEAVGPPPKTKVAVREQSSIAIPDTGEALEDLDVQDPMARAFMQQSMALTSLVAHLTTGDAIADLGSSSSSGPNLSTKGVARRERLQQELANGTSNFFLQVQQQLFRKMCPSKPIPKTEEDLLSSGVSMCSYLEKFGGFKGKADSGMLMWMLAHCVDAGARGDHRLMKEHLALAIACLEQSVLDGGWTVAYVLSLLEEPPHHVFSERPQSVSALGRPFSPLVPSSWAAVALSYLKEMELITTKKQETRGKPAPAVPKSGDPSSPIPPKRPKFPRKPKATPESPKEG